MRTTDTPTLQDFHIEGVKHINPSDALEALLSGEAIMIDVREMNEVIPESIPLDRVLNHPMSVIMDRLAYISKDQNIIVVCPGGVRSTRIANLLMQNGYGSVASLDGGLNTWKAKGFPIKYNTQTGCCSSSDKQPKTSVLIADKENVKSKDRIVDFKDLKRC